MVVQPQPFGGYAALGRDIQGINDALMSKKRDGISSMAELKELTVLVVDTGEFTLDWLLMKESGPVMKVSNAVSDAGRHRVIREIHKMIVEKMGRPVGNSWYSKIDQALRSKKKLRIAEFVFDFQETEFLEAVKKTVDDPVRQLFEGLRGTEDSVDLVVVVGGWPYDVKEAIEKTKDWLPVYCPEKQSIYNNLRGFQVWSQVHDSSIA